MLSVKLLENASWNLGCYLPSTSSDFEWFRAQSLKRLQRSPKHNMRRIRRTLPSVISELSQTPTAGAQKANVSWGPQWQSWNLLHPASAERQSVVAHAVIAAVIGARSPLDMFIFKIFKCFIWSVRPFSRSKFPISIKLSSLSPQSMPNVLKSPGLLKIYNSETVQPCVSWFQVASAFHSWTSFHDFVSQASQGISIGIVFLFFPSLFFSFFWPTTEELSWHWGDGKNKHFRHWLFRLATAMSWFARTT